MESGTRRLIRQNAMRSGLVVVGAVAFGYLSLQVGFKPYLERAQEAMERADADDRAGTGGRGVGGGGGGGGDEWSQPSGDASSIDLDQADKQGKWR